MSEFEIEREAKVHEDSNYTKNILEKYEYVKKPNENKDTQEFEDEKLFARLRKQVYGKETGKTRKKQQDSLSPSPEHGRHLSNLNIDHEGAKATFYSQTMGSQISGNPSQTAGTQDSFAGLGGMNFSSYMTTSHPRTFSMKLRSHQKGPAKDVRINQSLGISKHAKRNDILERSQIYTGELRALGAQQPIKVNVQQFNIL